MTCTDAGTCGGLIPGFIIYDRSRRSAFTSTMIALHIAISDHGGIFKHATLLLCL